MQNLRGIFLVLFSMAAFSIEDALIKGLSNRLPVGQILIVIGCGGVVLFLLAAGPAGRAAILPALRQPHLTGRTLAEGVGAITFATALSLVPLSTVAAVFQVTPLVVTAGAAVFLGERVGWRRWTAVVVGFLGVLLIIRPGLDGFVPEAALVLVTALAIACRDLLTRRIPADVPSAVVSFYGFCVVVLAGVLLLLLGQTPVPLDRTALWAFAAAICCATTGYYAIVASMRLADASALMPFRYARLVFSLLIGVAFFHEKPDSLTLAGGAIIIAAAFYTYQRERRLARKARVT
ncbi:MAG: DMT family transporter [Paracoccaceae bacterium]